MGAANRDQNRRERYRRVVEAAAVRETFTLDELKQLLPNERPSFVTRVVRLLERDGYLLRSGTKRKPEYRWHCRERFSAGQWLALKLSSVRLTDAPPNDRPRERLLAHGAASLRTAELLAILIRTGRPGESALQAGEKLAAHYADQLHRLAQAGRAELYQISPAISQAAYCQIMAGIELGRRVAESFQAERQDRPRRIQGPEDAIAECRERFARLAESGAQEEFHVLCLNTKHEVISSYRVTVGSLDASLVHPREVFRPAIKDAAAAVLLIHNHPSGDPTPSREDLAVTKRLEQAGETLGIRVLDHIVVARRRCISIRQYEQSQQF